MSRKPVGSPIDEKRRERYLKNRAAALAYSKHYHEKNREEHNKKMLANYHSKKKLKGRRSKI